jgi:DUF971 family protein
MGLLDRMSFTNREVAPPEAIDVTAQGAVHFVWPGGREVVVPALRLRDLCPCAGCVEEGTGKKILDPATIPTDIRPESITAVGNYAVQVQWSDGHNSGIYTWKLLREICGLDEAA